LQRTPIWARLMRPRRVAALRGLPPRPEYVRQREREHISTWEAVGARARARAPRGITCDSMLELIARSQLSWQLCAS
jgi:hypothetical protein